ncbi:TonB-dependent receptor plug domain-containing protein [Terriglobus roseus]|nr:TonB-dependent receptor [Terriglobus roseus]
MTSSVCFVVLAASYLPATAQQVPKSDPVVPPVKDTVSVVGDPEPVALGQSARAVTVLDMEDRSLQLQSLEDSLRTDASVDIRQRGPMGVQSDISIRGSNFEQTLVLLNALRVNDAQTSHFNLDIPVPLPALGGIAVLHGSGSTIYGSDALGGVVNVTTWKPTESSLRLRAGGGNYGVNTQSFVGAVAGSRSSVVVAGARDFSSGFMPDRDYRSESVSVEGRATTRLGESDLLVAGSDRAFGADQFYGNYPSWERTKGWFASLTQGLGAATTAAAAYRRHADVYDLIRDRPAAYENNHIDQSWQGAVRHAHVLGHIGRIFAGLEENTDSIRSNALGQHGRNRGAGYVDVDLHARTATFSAGLREEVLSGGRIVPSPTFAASVLLQGKWKLRGSAGYGFRLPTYTDLYYNDPTTISNPALKPESAWSFDGGVDWYRGKTMAVSVTGFLSQQSNAIEYLRRSSVTKWQASNLARVRLAGVEASLQTSPAAGQQLRVSWTATFGAQSALDGQQSQYLFSYPVNRAAVEWFVQERHGIKLRPAFSVTQRYGLAPYAVMDLGASREAGWLHPYVQLTNLANTGYAEILAVRMPGRGIVAGIEINLTRRH